MRRQHPRTTTSDNMFASKRIAVALCAAIAMVLGAMSVGATRDSGSSMADDTSSQDASSPLLANRSGSEDSLPVSNTPLSSNLQRQQTLVPAVITVKQPPILIRPKKPQLDIRLSPIQSLVEKDKIQLNLDTPALAPLSNSSTASITDAPETTEETSGSTSDNTQPTGQTDPETTEEITPFMEPANPQDGASSEDTQATP